MMRQIAHSAPGLAAALAVAVGVLVGMGSFTFWYGKGYSYLSEDPAACLNCHVMKDNFGSWELSTHRGVTCNECHLPHDLVGKYAAKVEHGFRHSVAFTLADVQILRVTPKSYGDLQENCIGCHQTMVATIVGDKSGTEVGCTRCHKGVGHVL